MTQQQPTADNSVFTIRRKVFTLFGAALHVYDARGQVLLYARMKAFRLKEDLRLFSGEDMQQEVMAIRARSVIDFSATYDVYDAATRQLVGSFRRRGLKSIVRDEWVMFDEQEREIGLIQEDSTGLALIRRFIELASLFLPQAYTVTMGGRLVARYRHHANPFVFKVTADASADVRGELDRRLLLAGGILLAAIEGRQS